MDSQVEEVKSRTDIAALVSNYVALKKSGRNYKGLCPFHSEKTASFMVSAERGIFKCFGCGEGGDSLTFYQKIEGVGFGEALKILAEKAGVTLKEYKLTPAEKEREVILKLNQAAAEFYHFLLTKHPSGRKALDYLYTRGLNDESIKDWNLGYAPDSWETTAKFLEKKKFAPKEIILSGLALPSQRGSLYDRFRGRIMFPIRSVSGFVVAFSGRILGEGEPKYLNSPDSVVFNKSAVLYGLDLAKTEIKRENFAVLVEGNLDVISSHQIGVGNVIAPLGTALTEKQLELVRRFSENLVISFDQDSAGFAASKRAITLADQLGINIKVAELENKDPDELIKKDPRSWQRIVKEAVSIYDYLINQSSARYGTSQEGLRRITAELTPLLAKIDNQIARSHYERVLAAKLGVEEEAVRTEVAKVGKVLKEPQAEKTKIKNEQITLEKYLFSLVLLADFLPSEVEEENFKEHSLQRLFQLLKRTSLGRKARLKELERELPEDLAELYNELTLVELPEVVLVSPEKIEAEISTCLLRLKELHLRTELQRLNLAIKQAEIRRSSVELEDLTKEFSALSEQLSKLEKTQALQ